MHSSYSFSQTFFKPTPLGYNLYQKKYSLKFFYVFLVIFSLLILKRYNLPFPISTEILHFLYVFVGKVEKGYFPTLYVMYVVKKISSGAKNLFFCLVFPCYKYISLFIPIFYKICISRLYYIL